MNDLPFCCSWTFATLVLFAHKHSWALANKNFTADWVVKRSKREERTRRELTTLRRFLGFMSVISCKREHYCRLGCQTKRKGWNFFFAKRVDESKNVLSGYSCQNIILANARLRKWESLCRLGWQTNQKRREDRLRSERFGRCSFELASNVCSKENLLRKMSENLHSRKIARSTVREHSLLWFHLFMITRELSQMRISLQS